MTFSIPEASKAARTSMGPIRRESAKCDQHGPYDDLVKKIDGKEVHGGCPACGLSLIVEESRRIRLGLENQAAERLALAQGIAGIPPRFKRCSFDAYVAANAGQARALSTAKSFARHFDRAMETGVSMAFIGKTGTGKTHLACAIGNHLLEERRYSVDFKRVGSLIRRIRETYRRDATETEEQAIRKAAAPDLLILDEVGLQRGTDDERTMLSEILSIRHEQQRPTLILGNVTKDQLSDAVGERVVSRLYEGGGGIVVFDWDDHRMRR